MRLSWSQFWKPEADMLPNMSLVVPKVVEMTISNTVNDGKASIMMILSFHWNSNSAPATASIVGKLRHLNDALTQV